MTATVGDGRVVGEGDRRAGAEVPDAVGGLGGEVVGVTVVRSVSGIVTDQLVVPLVTST